LGRREEGDSINTAVAAAFCSKQGFKEKTNNNVQAHVSSTEEKMKKKFSVL